MSNFLPTLYQEFIYKSRYAKFLDKEGRRENWNETVARYFDFMDSYLQKNMNYSISNNAEYGEITRGPRIVTEETKREMKRILAEIQSGQYARDFVLENKAGAPMLLAQRKNLAAHGIEKVGETLRAMMPWIKRNKMVDQSRN